jgi:hypothetical protein
MNPANPSSVLGKYQAEPSEFAFGFQYRNANAVAPDRDIVARLFLRPE